MLPSVTITKSDGNTGVVRPATSGVLAIIAPAQKGPVNTPSSFARIIDAYATYGLGSLVEYGGYFMRNAGKPVVLINPTTTTVAGIGTLVPVFATGSVTASVVASGYPLDEYNIVVNVVNGGTVGTTGLTYTYSLDGGVTTSALNSLGTATTITPTLPNSGGASSGVTFTLGGTLATGSSWTVPTTRAAMSNADLTASLEALRVSRLPWDAVLVDGSASATTVSTVDTWLAGLESVGIFKMAYLNTRHKTSPMPTGESEAAYATALGTLISGSSSTRVNVSADGGSGPSALTGLVTARPTSLAVATRKMSFPVGVDPAFVANGPIPGYQIADSNGNPLWHDEAIYPGLDALRLTTLRTIAGQQGVYITNANLLSASGSDYVYDQHAAVMNAACTIAYGLLTNQLSRGVGKAAPDATTGKIYILEKDAQAIEAVVSAAINQALKGQVNSASFQLSRTDDLSANSGATVNGEVQIQALAYVKNFAITAKFVKAISVTP